MARVADFCLFSDVSFSLKLGGDIDRTLKASLDGKPEIGEGALLMWNVKRDGAGTEVEYEVFVNGGSRETRYVVSENSWHSVHESVSTGKLNVGENEVRFRVISGSGTLSIGDVVLFFRQNT